MTTSAGPEFSFLQNVHVREMMKSHSVLGLVIRLNIPYAHLLFIIRWNVKRNRCWIVFSPAGFAVCLYAHLSFWCACRISVIATFSVTFRVSVRWTCWRRWTRSSLPFAFLVRVMLECACFSKCTLAFHGPTDAVFSLGAPPIARLSSSRFLALKWESLIFCSRDVFGPSTWIFKNHGSCRQMSSLGRRLAWQQVFQFFRLFPLSSCTNSPTCCQLVCQWLLIILPTLRRRPECCRSSIGLFDKSLKSRWLRYRH